MEIDAQYQRANKFFVNLPRCLCAPSINQNQVMHDRVKHNTHTQKKQTCLRHFICRMCAEYAYNTHGKWLLLRGLLNSAEAAATQQKNHPVPIHHGNVQVQTKANTHAIVHMDS